MTNKKPLITVMKRYEVKYVLKEEQVTYLKDALKGHMNIDKYGSTTIASLYYDTPDYRLIRTSMEKPPYKEKQFIDELRIKMEILKSPFSHTSKTRRCYKGVSFFINRVESEKF